LFNCSVSDQAVQFATQSNKIEVLNNNTIMLIKYQERSNSQQQICVRIRKPSKRELGHVSLCILHVLDPPLALRPCSKIATHRVIHDK
jgi:hypothetical protein